MPELKYICKRDLYYNSRLPIQDKTEKSVVPSA